MTESNVNEDGIQMRSAKIAIKNLNRKDNEKREDHSTGLCVKTKIHPIRMFY